MVSCKRSDLYFVRLTWKLTFFISDIKSILLSCERYSLKRCVLNLHMVFGALRVAFFCLMTFYQGGVCALCLTHSQSRLCLCLGTFSSVSSPLSLEFFGGSSTPDITRHDLREYCFNWYNSISAINSCLLQSSCKTVFRVALI